MTGLAVARTKNALGLVLLLALLIGGGTGRGLYSDFLIQIGIVIAAAAVFTSPPGARLSPGAMVLFFMVVLVGALQVIPLPAWLTSFGRPEVVSGFESAAGFGYVSLGVGRTLESLAFALTAFIFALSVMRLRPDQLRGLLPFFFVGLACNILAGAIQFSLASSSVQLDSFLPFQITAGLFANVNHFSTLLFVSIPLLVYFGIFMDRLLIATLSLICVLLILLAAGSRAGVLIGLAITVLSIAFVSWRSRFGALSVTGLFVVVAVYGFGAMGKIDVENLDPDFGRMEFARTTIEGIKENWLWGVGFGNFDRAYQIYERGEMIFRNYVNHVHNEYLEIVFEGGVAGAILLATYLILFIWRFRRAASEPLQRATFLSILFILLHSLVDYPLRTMALAVTFGFLNAVYFYQEPLRRRRPTHSQAVEVEHNGERLLVPIKHDSVLAR